jgi:polysaccharide export outer membrane protein
MKYKLTLLFASILFLCSCDSYKQVPYFQDLNRSSVVQENIKNYSTYTIQRADILGIYISSATNKEAAEAFSPNLNRLNGNIMDAATNNPIVGYLVDEKGNIQLPLLGTMKVEGYTLAELREQLLKVLPQYVGSPIVNIRIINFKISVMGDVLKPDIYTFQTDQVSIPQALASAGDLNITAKRNSLLLIREVNGKRVFVPLDLTSKNLFESPYFYLKNNDILYVDPDRTKYANVDRGYRNATIVLGVASVLAVIASVYVNAKK